MRSTTLLLSLVLLLGTSPAWGGAVVFATLDDSPINPNTAVELQGDETESVYLYVEFGSGSSAEPCVVSATGDEVCGFDVSIYLQGEAYIVDFVEETGVKYMPQSFTTDSRALRAVGVTAINPAAGPQRIGELVLDTWNADNQTYLHGAILIDEGEAVKANLDVFPIERDVMATTVPEPGEMLLLVSGILGLAALYRLRSRSARAA
jgi:hypothetical protein